jgi:F-box and WD-40 domain protein CDC4
MDAQFSSETSTAAIHYPHHAKDKFLDPSFAPRHQCIPAHGGKVVTALYVDTDNIISASDDHTVNIYDTQSVQLKHTLQGHTGAVWAMQYVDGMIVTGSTDRTVRVWNLETAECTHVFTGHGGTVRCLKVVVPELKSNGRYLPEEPVIVSGSRDKTLHVWRLPTKGTTYLPAPPEETTPDETKTLTSSLPINPYFVRKMEGHTHSIRDLAAEGDIAVSGSYDSTVRVWKISTGECQWVLKGHTSKVYSVVYDAGNNRVYSGSMDQSIKVWALTSGTLLSTLEGTPLAVL